MYLHTLYYDKYITIMETKWLFQQILLCTMEENREIKVFTFPLTTYLKRKSARGSRKSTRNLHGRGGLHRNSQKMKELYQHNAQHNSNMQFTF